MRLPDDLIAELDAEAQKRGLSRTAVMESRLRGDASVPEAPPVSPEVPLEPEPESLEAKMMRAAVEVAAEAPRKPFMVCPDCGAKPTSPKVLAEGKCFFCRRKLVVA